MANKVPARNKINKKFTWNSESVFKSPQAWEKEIKQIVEEIPSVKKYQGRLAEGSSVLLDAIKAAHDLIARIQIAFMYAGFSYAVDTTDQKAAGMRGRAQGIYGQVASAVSFLQPEILALGKEQPGPRRREKRVMRGKVFVSRMSCATLRIFSANRNMCVRLKWRNYLAW